MNSGARDLPSGKRSVIYIRCSTEHQAEKASPDEQERACRQLAERRGYTVAKVYRDTERYRVRGRLVEPSGTRADRPALRQMIDDGQRQAFDVIVAWKEDRLYRGYRPMLDVLDLLEEHKIGIDLAVENFDPRMAPVKAWAAKLELDGIKERMHMGKVGRLRANKPIGGQAFLGYDFVDGLPVVNEPEAETVRFIFNQVARGDADSPAGVSIGEVRRRLIARGCRQKTTRPKIRPWARGVIYSILNCETYLGKMKVHLNGDVYEVDFPPIIDQATWDRVREKIEFHKRNPVRNARELGFLLVGKLYGPCSHRLTYTVHRYRYERQPDGSNKRFDRARPLAYATCRDARDYELCDFRHVISLQQVEQAVWDQVAPFLLDLRNIRHVAEVKIKGWTADREKHAAEAERAKKALAGIDEQRRWVILQGRKQVLSDADMAEQLNMIEREAMDLRRELASANQALKAGADLKAMVLELARFLETYQGELAGLAAVPVIGMTLEQRRKVQRWFDAVVVRVDLGKDGTSLKIQTDPFGALRAVTNWSTVSRRR